MDLGSKDILSLIHDLNGKNVGERNKADKDIWECQQKIGFYKDIVSKILGNKNSDSELLQMFVQMVTRRWLQELDGLKTKEFFEEVKKPFIDLLLNINSPSSEKQLLEIVKKVAERSEARDEWLVDFLLKSGSILAIQALVVYFKSFDGIDDSIEMKNSNESITIFLQKSLEKSYKTDALMTTALIQLIDCILSHVWDMASEKSTSSLLVFEACMCILELETDAPEWLECQKSAMKLVENVCSYTVIEEGNIFARLFVNIKKRLENMTKEHCDDEMYEIMMKIVRLYSDVHKFEPGQKPSYLLSDIIISKALEVNIDEEATMCMTEPQSYAKSLIEDYFEINYRTSVRNVRLNSLCAFIREAVVYSSDYEHPSIQFFKEHQHWFTEGDLKEKHFIWSFIFSLLDDGDGVDYTHKNDFPFFDAQLKGFILRKSLHVLKQRLDKDYTQHPLIVCDVIKFLQWQRKQCSVDELKDLTDIMSSLLKVETHHAIEDMCLFFLHKTLFLQYDTSPVMPQDYLRQKLEELVDPSNHHHLKHTSLYLTVIKEVLATLNRGILPIPKVLYLFLKNCLRVIVDAPTDKKTDGRFVSLVFGCIQHLAWLAHFETYCSIEKNGFKSDNDLLDNFNDHFLEVFRDLVYHKQHQEYHLFILFLLVKTLSHSEKSLKNELTWVMVDVKEDSSYKMEKLTDAMKERSKNLNCIYLPIIAKFFPSNNFSTASLWWDKTHIDSLVFCAQVYIRKFPERMDRNALMQIALRLLDGPYDFCAKGLRIMLALVEVMDVALLKSEFPDILKVIVKALQYNQKRSFLLAICTFFGIIFLKLDAKFIVEACDSIKPRLFRDLCANVFLTSALKVGSYTDKNIFSHFIIGALEYFSDKVAEGKEVEKKENIDFCVRFIHLATVTKEEYTVQVHKPNYDGNSSFYDQMGVFSYLNEILFHEKPHFIQDSLKKLFDKHSFLIELEEYKTIKLEKNDKYDTVEKSKMKSFFERKKIASVPALSSYPDYEYYECE